MGEGGDPVKVLLVDDRPVLREGLAEILAAEDDLGLVGEAGDCEEAAALALEHKPDVVIMEIEPPGMEAEEAVRRMLAASPLSKVVVFTMHEEPSLLRNLLELGIRSCVIKRATKEELLAAVRAVARDEDRVVLSVSRTTLEKLTGREEEALSARELEVLSLAAEAMSNSQIASRLYISEGTVKRHLTNVYSKLGVSSRIEAINKALRAGLITTDGPSELGR
jgi:DNA-binding NarL/FixJ family response regulator